MKPIISTNSSQSFDKEEDIVFLNNEDSNHTLGPGESLFSEEVIILNYSNDQ